MYKKRVWNLLCPDNLCFPKGIIRNILIEQNDNRIITHIKKITVLKNEQMTEWI